MRFTPSLGVEGRELALLYKTRGNMKVKSGSEGRCECYFVLYTAKAGGGKSLDYVDRKLSSCDQNRNQRLMLRKEAVILGTQ